MHNQIHDRLRSFNTRSKMILDIFEFQHKGGASERLNLDFFYLFSLGSPLVNYDAQVQEKIRVIVYF
jgi:hypothetical protein